MEYQNIKKQAASQLSCKSNSISLNNLKYDKHPSQESSMSSYINRKDNDKNQQYSNLRVKAQSLESNNNKNNFLSDKFDNKRNSD